jgi:hypothetical protein
MKLRVSKPITKKVGLSIVEVDNPTAVQHFDSRFQVVLEVDKKRILPKLKNKFCSFEDDDYIYLLKSEKTGEQLLVDGILYHEKQICDKTLEDCTTELQNYIALYEKGGDVEKVLKSKFNF